MVILKNIIFDLGNVIVNINPSLTSHRFQQLGYTHFDFHSLNKEEKEILEQYEAGRISSREFRNYIRKRIDPQLNDSTIDEAWNTLLLDVPKARLKLLKELGAQYRLFLLSNTNEIHIAQFNKYLEKEHRIANLSPFFEKEYYSYKIQLRKPDAAIYKLVLEENSIRPEETLFIDDSEENIFGAQKLNINTYHLRPEKESILDVNLLKLPNIGSF